MPWYDLYLLQVRNHGWKHDSNIKFYNFIKFLINWSWEKCQKDFSQYFYFLQKAGFNILSTFYGNKNRYTCAIQSNLSIRLNDMKIFPCHRLMYPDFELGYYDNNMNIKATNVGLGITINGLSFQSAPGCELCDINELCQGGCLGSQYETNSNLLAPIPTVCLNQIYLCKALVDGFEEIKILDKLLPTFAEEKRRQIKILRSFNVNDLQ